MDIKLITLGWVTVILTIWGVTWGAAWNVLMIARKEGRTHVEGGGVWIIFWFSLSAVLLALLALGFEELAMDRLFAVVACCAIAGGVLTATSLWSLINPHPERIALVYWPAVTSTLVVGVGMLVVPALLKAVWLLWLALFWLLMITAVQVFVHLRRLTRVA